MGGKHEYFVINNNFLGALASLFRCDSFGGSELFSNMSLQLLAYTPAAYERNLSTMLKQFQQLQMKLFFVASNHALTRYVLQQRELEAHLKEVKLLHAKNAMELLQHIRGLESPTNEKQSCGVIIAPFSQLVDHWQGYEQTQYVQTVEKLLERLEKQGMMVVKVEN